MHATPARFENTPYAMHLSPAQQNVMAIGAIGVGLGLFGLCVLPFVAEPVISEYLGRGGVLPEHGLINTWGLISTSFGCMLSAMLMFGGVGCLRFRPWARPLMLAYGAFSVLLGLAGIYFHILILSVIFSENGLPSFATRVTGLAEWVAWVVGTIVGVATLWVLTRPDAVKAFHPDAAASSGGKE